MQLANWITKNPVCIGPDDTLEKAGLLMASGGFRQLPVVEKNQLIGMITDRDLRQHQGYFGTTRVDAAMSTPALYVNRGDSAEAAAKLLIERKVGALPVVEDGRVVGIVSTSDLLKALLCVVQATQGIIER